MIIQKHETYKRWHSGLWQQLAKGVEKGYWYKEVEVANQHYRSKPNREPMESSQGQSSYNENELVEFLYRVWERYF